MPTIHPTAIVEDGARIADDVRIGPFCTIGPEVVLEAGIVLHSHVVLTSRTTIGAGTEIFPFAMLGGPAQDLSYRGEPTDLVIGPNCVIRESVTVHRGTPHGRSRTVIGERCFLMAYSHVAHDCIVGNRVIMTNNATLGGHSVIGDSAILGGLSAVQQKVRIGAHAFIGGLTGVTSDIIPFGMAVGDHAHLAGLNIVGLKRRGFDRATIYALRAVYRQFFFSGGARAERIASAAEAFGGNPAVDQLLQFLRESGERPLTLPRDRLAET